MKTVSLLLCIGSFAASAALADTALAQTAAAPPPPPFGPPVSAGRTLRTPDMINPNPLIPADIYRQNNKVDHKDLATFAWLEFISAVAPDKAGSRGVPGGSFADSGSGKAGPLVWETYQHRTELLPCNVSNGNAAPTPPQPWGAAPTYVTHATNSSPQACSTITVPGGTSLPYNNLDEATQIGQNSLFYPAKPGNPQPASDPQVLFEAKANQYESDFVLKNYNSLIPKFGPFHFSPAITLPTGTVEVKAAWVPLKSIPTAQQNRYHIAQVLTYGGKDTAPVPQLESYALLALHIIHKTPNYPAFIFATFEQVDDFTNQATGKPSGVYYVPTYGNVGYSLSTSVALPPSGATVSDPLNNLGFSLTSPSAAPYGAKSVPLPLGPVTGIPGAKTVNGVVTVPVTSPVPTVPEVAKANAEALAAMKGIPGFGPNFVWQYYKLTGVQAIPTNDESSRDFYLANIVVESSQPGIQLFRGFPPIALGLLNNFRNQTNVIDSHNSPATMTSGGGCQGCHGIAQTQNGFDFSFLFFGAAGGGFSPETVGLSTTEVAAARLLGKKYFQP